MDDRRDAEPPADEARFAEAVVGRRDRPPLVLFAFLMGIAGLIVAGFGGRVASAPAQTSPTAVAASPRASIAAQELATAGPDRTPPASGATTIVSSEPGSSIELTVQRHQTSMFVHGDVSVAGVSWVFVNITGEDGRIAGWTSVSVPGGAVAPTATGPALRFDVELALPDWATGPLSVRANAYAQGGDNVASEELSLAADGSPGG